MTARTTILADADAVAAELARVIADAAAARPAVGILLAGGTTPRRGYELLGALPELDLAGVHLWYGDERMVAPSHPDSNHGMVARAWLDRIPADRAPVVHRIPGELGGIAAARHAAAALRAHAGDAPAFDLAIVGAGADGHTASLFPGDPATTAEGLYFPARGGTRVTATIALLARARAVVVVVTGAAKAAIVARVLRSPPSPDLPLSIVAARASDVSWIIDRAAARLTC